MRSWSSLCSDCSSALSFSILRCSLSTVAWCRARRSNNSASSSSAYLRRPHSQHNDRLRAAKPNCKAPSHPIRSEAVEQPKATTFFSSLQRRRWWRRCAVERPGRSLIGSSSVAFDESFVFGYRPRGFRPGGCGPGGCGPGGYRPCSAGPAAIICRFASYLSGCRKQETKNILKPLCDNPAVLQEKIS